MGDTYHKLFCDPKLPFADCASKWYNSSKSGTKKTEEVQKMSSDEEEHNSEGSGCETRMSLRRSKRTSAACERDDDDTDALSELETLAKLGRVDEALSTDMWFTERALETRLHHIAHAVQNCEWPSAPSKPGDAALRAELQEDRKQTQKRHIAIDVETDRAKLHALLSSPQAAHSGGRDQPRERDDASSDSGSRRSTPAPPPAHQRVAPSPAPPAAAPVDLSAPLDLSEAHDFSLGRRTPLAADPAPSSSRSRLDDTLTKLMKRKNVVSVFVKLITKYDEIK